MTSWRLWPSSETPRSTPWTVLGGEPGEREVNVDAEVDAGAAVTVKVFDRRTTYQACARSWKRRPDVGSNPHYPDLSARDAHAVKAVK